MDIKSGRISLMTELATTIHNLVKKLLDLKVRTFWHHHMLVRIKCFVIFMTWPHLQLQARLQHGTPASNVFVSKVYQIIYWCYFQPIVQECLLRFYNDFHSTNFHKRIIEIHYLPGRQQMPSNVRETGTSHLRPMSRLKFQNPHQFSGKRCN